MKKKLVIITQKVDETDDLLGFFVGWIWELARHYERVEVITLGKGEYVLPENVIVHSLGKERGVSKIRQLFTFYFLLFTLTPKASAVFCHMSPVFALIAWPFARIFKARLVLWYLHRSVTVKLKLALRLVDILVTADADSLGVQSSKIVSVGHGIDTEYFSVPDRTFDISNRVLRIISVGRLSPIKDFGTLIRAAKILKEKGKDIEVRIVGRAVMSADRIYEKELRQLVEDAELSDVISFVGFVPYRDMPTQYRWADMVVGGTPKGGLDKAILEGMAAGCIPFTSNSAMRPYLEAYAERLIFGHGDASDLALRLGVLNAHETASHRMVTLVSEHHALPGTVGRLSTFL